MLFATGSPLRRCTDLVRLIRAQHPDALRPHPRPTLTGAGRLGRCGSQSILHAELARLAPGHSWGAYVGYARGRHVAYLLEKLSLGTQRRIIVGMNGELARLDQGSSSTELDNRPSHPNNGADLPHRVFSTATNGYWDRVLHVDLRIRSRGTGRISWRRFGRRHLGGRSLIAHGTCCARYRRRLIRWVSTMCWYSSCGILDRILAIPVCRGATPSAPKNRSLTGAFGEAEAGGFWGLSSVMPAGTGSWCTAVPTVRADLWIADEHVEIRDAGHLCKRQARSRTPSGSRMAIGWCASRRRASRVNTGFAMPSS